MHGSELSLQTSRYHRQTESAKKSRDYSFTKFSGVSLALKELLFLPCECPRIISSDQWGIIRRCQQWLHSNQSINPERWTQKLQWLHCHSPERSMVCCDFVTLAECQSSIHHWVQRHAGVQWLLKCWNVHHEVSELSKAKHSHWQAHFQSPQIYDLYHLRSYLKLAANFEHGTTLWNLNTQCQTMSMIQTLSLPRLLKKAASRVLTTHHVLRCTCSQSFCLQDQI